MRRGDGAALLGFGSVGFEIRLLRVSGLTVRKIAFQMLIFTAVGLQIRPSGVLSDILPTLSPVAGETDRCW